MKLIISNVSGVPIYEQIKQQIKAAILSGELQAEETLPSLSRVLEHLHQNALTFSDLQQIRKAVNCLMPMCQSNRQTQRELMGVNARTTALLNTSYNCR